jgi:putative (di)nucleoside polyphosphate hydrolase
MADDHRREVFRAGVGMVVLDADGRVLALERRGVPGAWQLPQGGLEPGEDEAAAAWRELAEETGLRDDHVALVDRSELWFGYELPPDMRSEKTGRGQVHRWFLFSLRPGVEVPPLPVSGGREFTAARWMTFDELIDATIDFRRPAYRWLQSWVGGGYGTSVPGSGSTGG